MKIQDTDYKPFYLRLHILLWRAISWPARFVWKCRRGFAIFLLLLAALHGIAVVVTNKMVNNAIAEIRAKGEPINSSELRGPTIPNNQNAYVVFKQVEDKIHDNAALQKIEKEILFSSKSYKNNYDKLKYNMEQRKELKDWIKKNSDVFVLLQKAVSMPYFQDENRNYGPSALFPYLSYIRKSQYLYCNKAYIEALDGNIDNAIADNCTALKMGNILKTHPTAFGALVRSALDNIAIKNIIAISDNNNLNYEQARKLNSALTDINYKDIYKTGLLGERVLGLWIFNHMNPNYFSTFSDNPSQYILWRLRSTYLFRPLFNLDKLRYLNIMSFEINNRPKPYYYKKKIYYENSFGSIIRDRLFPISDIFASSFNSASNRFYETESNIDGTRVYLGIIAYKDKLGIYPNSLDELKNKLNWETPIDICSGKAFTYKKKGSGFLLYGYGSNGKDDHGVKRSFENHNNLTDKYDIVWEKDD